MGQAFHSLFGWFRNMYFSPGECFLLSQLFRLCRRKLGVVEVVFLVKVRADFLEPFGLDGHALPHELLACENELVVDQPLFLGVVHHT